MKVQYELETLEYNLIKKREVIDKLAKLNRELSIPSKLKAAHIESDELIKGINGSTHILEKEMKELLSSSTDEILFKNDFISIICYGDRLYVLSKAHRNSANAKHDQPILHVPLDRNNNPIEFSTYAAEVAKMTKSEIAALIDDDKFPLKAGIVEAFGLEGVKLDDSIPQKIKEKKAFQERISEIKQKDTLKLKTIFDTSTDLDVEVLQGEYAFIDSSLPSKFIKTIGMGPCHALVLYNPTSKKVGLAHIDSVKNLDGYCMQLKDNPSQWRVFIIGGQTNSSEETILHTLETLKHYGIEERQIEYDILGSEIRHIIFSLPEEKVYYCESAKPLRKEQERTILALRTVIDKHLIEYKKS